MINIESYSSTSDWYRTENHEIEPEEIFGFELHWRGENWHVVVKTKEKCADGYYSYELGHWLPFSNAVDFISNKDVKILKIYNYHSSDNFNEALFKLITASVQEEKR